MEAIILAGGFGTRLRSVLPDTPKPMAPIDGQPFLARLIDYLGRQGFKKIILSVGYKHEIIESYFGNQRGLVEISYSVESEPLGTGGAIKKALMLTNSENVFVLNGDTFVYINYREMLASRGNDFSRLCIALRTVDNVSRYGAVLVENNEVTSFVEKAGERAGLINSGVYLMPSNFFGSVDVPEKFSFERDLLYPCVERLRPQAFITEGYFVDIGIPEDYQRAQLELIKWIEGQA